jgi:membrane protease subunit HflK
VYANSTKVLVDTHSSTNLLNLPLDKLVEQARTAPPSVPPPVAGAASAPAVPAAPTYPPQTDDARSRDPARSREREAR